MNGVNTNWKTQKLCYTGKFRSRHYFQPKISRLTDFNVETVATLTEIRVSALLYSGKQSLLYAGDVKLAHESTGDSTICQRNNLVTILLIYLNISNFQTN